MDNRKIASELLKLAKEMQGAETISVVLFDDLQGGKGRVIETGVSLREFDKIAKKLGFKNKIRDRSLAGYYYTNDEGDDLLPYPDIYSKGDKVKIQ